MARKDFDEYYNRIFEQHERLMKVLEDMSKEVEENIIPPERLDELKKTIQPVKTSYETLLYIKYLLDMPNRNRKSKNMYQSKVEKLSGKNYGPVTLESNKQVIDNLTL